MDVFRLLKLIYIKLSVPVFDRFSVLSSAVEKLYLKHKQNFNCKTKRMNNINQTVLLILFLNTTI